MTTTDTTFRLRPPANRVPARAALWWTLQAVLIGIPVLAGAVVAYVLWGDSRPWLLVVVLAAGAFAAGVIVVEPWWRYRVHRWETTDEAVYATTGWVVREWRVAPISRIQTVDAVRGPLEQLLGLATLRVTTASSRGAVNIVGLDAADATAAAEHLAAIARLSPGDAT